jgi:hypothetical protein
VGCRRHCVEAARIQFRRVKGYRQLPQLAAALQAATADQPDLLDFRVTASWHDHHAETVTEVLPRHGHPPWNTNPTPYRWVKTAARADAILESLATY